MEKIAIPSEGDRFATHFGRCPEYAIIEIDGENIINKKVIPNPGHEPGYLPRYLRELGVDSVLACGMGKRALNLFNSNNIKVVTGATGSIEEGIKLYLKNELKTEGNACEH
jgi:predicted Fe-Mo cluster-binding NifX family protein